MSDLVKFEGNELVTSTQIIAKGMKLSHHATMVLVDKYRERLETRGVVAFEMRKPLSNTKGGRPVRIAWLNESQFLFLATLMRNSETVLDFKDKLTKEFIRQRKIIAQLLTQRTNAAWLEERAKGILSRKAETDVIQKFVEYCKSQGSSHADMYYANISKMENKALFILEQEFPNLRNALSGQQLQIVASADIAVARALKYGMDQRMAYKEIYQLAKDRILQFAEIVGKTTVPMEDTLLLNS